MDSSKFLLLFSVNLSQYKKFVTFVENTLYITLFLQNFCKIKWNFTETDNFPTIKFLKNKSWAPQKNVIEWKIAEKKEFFSNLTQKFERISILE